MSEHKLESLTGGSGVHVFLVLWKAARAVEAYAGKSISELEMCGSDFAVLEALLHKGPLTITEIQAKVLLASGSMTAAVDRVEKMGLVIRKTTAKDRRARILELTPQGRRLIEKAFAEHVLYLEEAMSALDAKEKIQLYGVLKKLGRAVSGGEHDEQTNPGDSPHHGNRG